MVDVRVGVVATVVAISPDGYSIPLPITRRLCGRAGEASGVELPRYAAETMSGTGEQASCWTGRRRVVCRWRSRILQSHLQVL
jgi:hypothetical protein